MKPNAPLNLRPALAVTTLLLAFTATPTIAWSGEQTNSTQALQLLAKLDKSDDVWRGSLWGGPDRIATAVRQWKDDQTNTIFVGDSYACRNANASDLEKAIGKPTRIETFEQLKQLDRAMATVVRTAEEAKAAAIIARGQPFLKVQLKDGAMTALVMDKSDEGKRKLVPLVDLETKRCLPGRVLWYDSVGFGFVKTAHEGEFLAILLTQPRPGVASAPQKEPPK